MAKSSCSFEFAVSSVDNYETTCDLLLNVTKRWHDVYYRANVSDRDVLISYLRAGTLSAANNLKIVDRSFEVLVENKDRDISQYEKAEGAIAVTVDSEWVLFTDVYVTGTSIQIPVPLFFKHQIPEDHFDPGAGHKVTSLKILNDIMVEESGIDTYFDSSAGALYSNIESAYNSSDRSYTVYYLQYTVRESTTVFKTYTVLLDNQAIFELAEADDLDPWGNLIVDGRKVYLKEQQPNGTWLFTFPANGDYAYRVLDETRLKILLPVEGEAHDPWFVSASNATFFSSVGGITYKYHIAEVGDQYFDPVYPVRYADRERATVLNKNLIKLGYSDVINNADEDMFVSVLLYGSANELMYAFTTDPGQHGDYVGKSASGKNVYYSCIESGGLYGIRSVDRWSGFIDIRGVDLKTSYIPRCSYYYNFADYPLTEVNFNPTQNRDILDHTVVYFIIPDLLSSSRAQTLYMIKVNEDGRVVYSDWEDFDNTTQKLDNGHYLFYGEAPTWFTGVYGTGVESFVGDYTVNGTGYFLVLGECSFGA